MTKRSYKLEFEFEARNGAMAESVLNCVVRALEDDGFADDTGPVRLLSSDVGRFTHSLEAEGR